MKILKSEQLYIFDDFRELQCGICKKKLWDKGREIVANTEIRCPQCGATYSFEPIRWRVQADIPEE